MRIDLDPTSELRSFPDNRHFELAAGESLETGQDFVLHEPARFAGTVVASASEQSELVVELWSAGDDSDQQETTRPNREGAFGFSRVKPGVYRITGSANQTVSVSFTGASGPGLTIGSFATDQGDLSSVSLGPEGAVALTVGADLSVNEVEAEPGLDQALLFTISVAYN